MSRADELDPNASLEEWLAYDVRRFREERGITQQELARKLRISYQLMCNLEANRRKFRRAHVEALDELWDAKGHFVRLWIHSRREHDREWFRKYVAFERQAREVELFQPLFVPGLFQTKDYARALLTAGRIPDVEASIQARLSRQEILTADDHPEVLAILDEKALRQPVGGREVMRAQLARLLEVATMPHVTIQVVPTRVGAYVGLDGGFNLLATADEKVGFSEAQLGGRLIRDETEVRTLEVMYGRIRTKALSEDDSATLIESILEAPQ